MGTDNGGQVLILCGLPGSGKSTYAADLERRGWARLSIDHPEEADPAVAAAWSRAWLGADEDLVAIASRCAGVVIEWGFHPINLPTLEAMVARGYVAWFFEGDRMSAYEGWMEAHPDLPERLWFDQVERLDLAAVRIRALFGTRCISIVGPGRTYMPIAEIDRVLDVSS